MSPEAWLWGVVALGHVVVIVWSFNVSHALGLDEHRIKGVKVLLLTLLALVPCWLVGEARGGPWWTWSPPAQVYVLVCLASAFLGLPAATVVRACRRAPAGVAEHSEAVDVSEGLGREAFIGSGKHSWMLRLPGNESLRLRKREWQVPLPGLPTAWDGLSVVHITDLHFAPCFERRFFDAVVDAAGGWDADLVLFTGDLIDHDRMVEWVAPVLSRLRGRLGQYAILGNHDVIHRPPQILEALEQAGFTSLEGRWARVNVGARMLALGGTSYPWGPLPPAGAMPEADFRILMSHSPDQLYRAARWGIDLMLSGHNHGGQIRLPVVGPVFMPSLYSRRFDRGFFRAGGTLLHVSQGVSGMHPLRYGCVPEVSRLVLRAMAHPHFSATGRDRRARDRSAAQETFE